MQAVDIEFLRQVAILVVNEVELQQLGKHLGLPTDGTVATCLPKWRNRPRTPSFSRSGLKDVWRTTMANKSPYRHLAINPIDTVGAGDAFCGAFAAALDA